MTPALLLLKFATLALLALFVVRALSVIAADLEVRVESSEPTEIVGSPRLEVLQGVSPAPGERIEIVSNEITVGRSADNSLQVQDEFVSGHHARIHRDGNHYWLEDCGSTNGTLVNGARIDSPLPLRPGDEITIGGTIFRFDAEAGT